MSDDDYNIDIEDDAERRYQSIVDKERRKRIKDSFTSLKNAVPTLQRKFANRTQILKGAAEYIQTTEKNNIDLEQNIDELTQINEMLDIQITTALRKIWQLKRQKKDSDDKKNINDKKNSDDKKNSAGKGDSNNVTA